MTLSGKAAKVDSGADPSKCRAAPSIDCIYPASTMREIGMLEIVGIVVKCNLGGNAWPWKSCQRPAVLFGFAGILASLPAFGFLWYDPSEAKPNECPADLLELATATTGAERDG
jgi:hypothetical protein